MLTITFTGEIESIEESYQFSSARSLILDRNGMVWEAKKDETWIDENGRDHLTNHKRSIHVASAYKAAWKLLVKLDGNQKVYKIQFAFYSIIICLASARTFPEDAGNH